MSEKSEPTFEPSSKSDGKKRGRILLIDDDPGLLRLMSLRLESEGYSLETAGDGESALGMIENKPPDLVIADWRMRPMDGVELLERLQTQKPSLPVLLITAYGTVPDAVEATQKGAYSVITKPIDTDALVQQVEEAIALHRSPRHGDRGETRMVTRNAEMMELMTSGRMVAGTDSSVLINGESGTGKEVLARFIHDNSTRANAEFVAVNCNAIPENLLESELFGHVKGAFTGANRDHPGLFRSAEGGTLLLDEIGDLPLSLQVTLLRALEERRIRPVGSTREVPVDVRVLSATHQNLVEGIENGTFREDLYYRLNVVNLRLPPLRERREDIPLLAEQFLSNTAEKQGADTKVYSPHAMMRLSSGEWPGNIRQLQNVVEQNVALSPARVISLRQVERAMAEMPRTMQSFADARADFARNYLSQLLHICEGNVSQAARTAERNRTDFYKLLNRYNIDPADYK